MNWKKVKLGEICEYQKKSKIKAGEGKAIGEFPFFTSSTEQTKYLDFHQFDETGLIFGTGGKANAHYCNEKFAVSTDCLVMKNKKYEEIYLKCIYYYLSGNIQILENGFKGAGLKHISKEYISNLEIPLPPLSTQKHIAEILDKADALRQQNRQLLSYYDELLQSTFIELFGNKNKNYPSWDLKKIEEIVENRKGSMRSGPFGSDLLHSEFVDSGVFVLGIDNVVNNKFEWGKMRYITEEKYQKLKRYTVVPGDLLISIMATLGRVAIVPKTMPLAINSKHLAAISLDKNIVEPVFIAYNLHSNPEVKRQISVRGRGAIMEGLNLGLIKEIKIKIPPLPLQQHFAKIVEQIEAQKAVAQAALAESETLFEGLLVGYFNG
jgi:type I restriction enzyme, S subunit